MINEIHDTQQLTPKAKENLLRNITPRVIDLRNVRPDKTCECLHNSWDPGINTVETMDDPPSHCRKSPPNGFFPVNSFLFQLSNLCF